MKINQWFFVPLHPKYINYRQMAETKEIKTALVSVFHKDGLEELLAKLDKEGVKFLSTGGTQKFIESLGYVCQTVESVTTYPSILGGRVKTLHPKIFGGILARRENDSDIEQMKQYEIPAIDLVIVDLYPFEATVASGAVEADIIEKIDIGGISLIRAGAKNFKDVVIIPSKNEYGVLLNLLNKNGAKTEIEDRRMFASRAFGVSSHYDTAIQAYFEK
jgi:AICAR transformylase/IMP cyclohydrolase PurH